jgi:hypothetical protein
MLGVVAPVLMVFWLLRFDYRGLLSRRRSGLCCLGPFTLPAGSFTSYWESLWWCFSGTSSEADRPQRGRRYTLSADSLSVAIA